MLFQNIRNIFISAISSPVQYFQFRPAVCSFEQWTHFDVNTCDITNLTIAAVCSLDSLNRTDKHENRVKVIRTSKVSSFKFFVNEGSRLLNDNALLIVMLDENRVHSVASVISRLFPELTESKPKTYQKKRLTKNPVSYHFRKRN